MDKNKTTYKLLEFLSDGEFHSGEQLAKSLHITRSAIWKAIRQLQNLDVEIHAVSGKGYRIPHRLELLDKDQIQQNLKPTTFNAIDELVVLLTTTSTNDYLLNLVKQQSRKTIACLAEHQSKGRGRYGRSWVSSFGSSCYLSLLWYFDKDPRELMGLSLVIGVALVNALKAYGVRSAIQLKWPNDVLWQGRKLAGILIEMLAEPYGVSSVVIGVGLNLQIPPMLDDQITQPWVDLAEILDDSPKRNAFIVLLMDELVEVLQQFSKKGLDYFISQWKQYDELIGKSVVLTTTQGYIEGVLQDISLQGELIIKTPDNTLQRFVHGEVSLREGVS